MQSYEGFPAPERDMANVSPEIPPVESDVGPVTGWLLAMLTVALGISACLWGFLGMVLEGNQAPPAASAMIGAGICFIAAGALTQTRSVVLPVIAGVTGILLGVASRTMF